MDNVLSLKMDFVFNRLFSKKGNERSKRKRNERSH